MGLSIRGTFLVILIYQPHLDLQIGIRSQPQPRRLNIKVVQFVSNFFNWFMGLCIRGKFSVIFTFFELKGLFT